MLYLNVEKISFASSTALYLTLTSVVFELKSKMICFLVNFYLTLTSVVFEFFLASSLSVGKLAFNFNKCCIWIADCNSV